VSFYAFLLFVLFYRQHHIEMENQSVVYMLVLTGLSDLLNLQLLLFLLFLVVYFMTLIINLLILLLIFTDSHLHTPMYFFLGTLACLDMSYSSVTAPRMLFDLFTGRRIISVPACITQVYFFIFFGVSEVFLLAVMSYDRYIAICRPLHYMQIMSWNVCVQFVSGVLVSTSVYSLLHTLFLSKLTFCSSNVLQSFFCDLPQLLQVSCSDTFINVLLIFLFGILLGIGILGKNMRQKAFSTCISHLAVVFIFYGTLFFNYFRPTTDSNATEGRLVSIFYTVFTPLLNPFVYSLRNQEFQTALRRALQGLRILNKHVCSSSS
uniref:Olfactory receptor n=1 Tax=Xenopus tropicalis TaxID=8364 RepID=A0A6I8PMY9_XENTR